MTHPVLALAASMWGVDPNQAFWDEVDRLRSYGVCSWCAWGQALNLKSPCDQCTQKLLRAEKAE